MDSLLEDISMKKYECLHITLDSRIIKTFHGEYKLIPDECSWKKIEKRLRPYNYRVLLSTENERIYNIYNFEKIIVEKTPRNHPAIHYLYNEYKNGNGDTSFVCNDGVEVKFHSIIWLCYNNNVNKLCYSEKIVRNFLNYLYVGKLIHKSQEDYEELISLLDYLHLGDILLDVFTTYYNKYPMAASKVKGKYESLSSFEGEYITDDLDEQKEINMREIDEIMKEIHPTLERVKITDEYKIYRGSYEENSILYIKRENHPYEDYYQISIFDNKGNERIELICNLKIQSGWSTTFKEKTEKELCEKYGIKPFLDL